MTEKKHAISPKKIKKGTQSVSFLKTTVAINNATCTVIHGDSRVELAAFEEQADLIVTSPPYADARSNHYDSVHPDQFADWFMSFHESYYKALKPTGSLIINIKDKVVDSVRHRYVWHMVEKLCDHGWFAIDDYIWHKTNPMPGYWPTRLRDGWEYCFHLAKSKRPYFNPDAVRKPIGDWVESRLKKLGQNDLSRHNSVNASGFGRDISKWVGKQTALPSNVLSIALVGKNKGHPAVFPIDLPLFFIKLLSPENGLVIDPFGGSGSTGVAAISTGRSCILIDNNLQYCQEAIKRLQVEAKNHENATLTFQANLFEEDISTDISPPHPGVILRERFLEPLRISWLDLPQKLNLTAEMVGELLGGKQGITPDLALRLERLFQVEAEFWLQLQLAWEKYHTQEILEIQSLLPASTSP